ncbi:hypothetical protein [Streptomyces sp. NPDC051577]|uniref:hypothetical protein n=1 Tax=Streptomyces sp. NPDC051577 TaxID=3155166 RepID=UPI00344A99FF
MPVPDLRAYLLLGGVWTDLGSDLLHAEGVRYSWGRRAEGSRADPSATSLTLLNPDGKYSGRNPASPYFGQLGRNTRLRVTHGGAPVALVAPSGVSGRASTPDVAALDITGDIDIRIDLTASVWTGLTTAGAVELLGKYGSAAGARSWFLDINNGGNLIFWWSPDGTSLLNASGNAPVPFAPGTRGALRTTLDVNNGLGGYTVTQYYADTLAGPWTQLGTQTVTTSGTTSIANTTASLEVGDIAAIGFERISKQVHAAEVRSGINGTVVANPDFTAQASGTTSFTDSAGRTWTVGGGGEITSRRIRFEQEASSWLPRWGASGRDVTTPVEAAGILRRLGQGDKALASALRRRIPAYSPVAYWPMEEGRDAVQASSPIPGVLPLTTVGFEYAADDTCPGSSSLPSLTAASSARGVVPPYTATGQWLVSFVYLLETLPASDSVLLDITTTGTLAHIVISVSNTTIKVRGYDTAGVTVHSSDTSPPLAFADADWRRLDLSATDLGGGSMELHLAWVAVGGNGNQVNATISASPGIVTGIGTTYGAGLADMRIGHLSVFSSSSTSVFASADGGYSGERCGARLLRLGGEEAVPITVMGVFPDMALMGVQHSDPLLDLLEECEAADGGILYEDHERLALMYRSRTSLHNQAPKAVIPYAKLAPPLEPTDDDRYVRNDRTVERVGGSSARAVLTSGPLSVAAPPAGVGVYDDSQSLSLAYDEQCDDIAHWLLHRGTWDESRYPRVTVYLHKYPELIPTVSALRPGDVMRITDLPPWLPPGPLDLMVEGGDDTFRTHEWTIVFACSPAGPWNVAYADDSVYGRADTDGSVLSTAATSTATTLVVHTSQTADSTNPRWTQDPAELPIDLIVGGEVVTATAVTTLAEDTFARTIAAGGWGTASDGHTYALTGGTGSERSVSGGLGLITVASSPTTLRMMTVDETCADADIRCTVSVSAVATGAALVTSIGMRWSSASSCYRARVEWGLSGAISLSAVVGSTLIDTAVATGLSYSAGTQYDVRVRLIGHRILMRIWPTGGIEPATWQLDRTATSGTIAAGQVGIGGGAFTSNSNASVEYRFDNWSVESPQRMTVTRSVNGISKAQAAGADIRLAHPAITSY